jgi:hypothetical protein
LHHFVRILSEFRIYDKIQIIENDTYVINKILKLSIMNKTYFQIFDKLLEDIIFIPDICKIVKVSIYPRITTWFKNLSANQFFEKREVLLIFGLLLASHPKLNLYNVYEVAIRNNLL